MKEESEQVGLKLNIQKTKIMASGPTTSWEIDGEKVETVSNFIFLGLQNHCRWWLIFLLAVLIPACASSSPVFLLRYSAYKLKKQGDNISNFRYADDITLMAESEEELKSLLMKVKKLA